MTITKPPALAPGATVGIVAPGSNLKPDMLASGVAELERLGFRVRHRGDILDKHRYTAGSRRRRLEEFRETWRDPEIDIVMAARGGYGSIQLLPDLDPSLFREHPKIFVGYSDITALQLYLWKTCRLVTFHGPMAAKDFAGGPTHYDWESFKRLLESREPAGALASPDTRTLVGGRAEGRLLGGCMSLVASLMGTPWQLETDGAILYLEDTATKPYQLDRMLHQMKLAGMFDGAHGVVFGEMSDCFQHPAQGYVLDEVLSDFVRDLGVPAVTGWRSGHSERGNLTLPLGIRVELDADARTLAPLESAVL